MTFLKIHPDFAGSLRGRGVTRFEDFYMARGREICGGHASRDVQLVKLGGFRGYLKRQFWIPWQDYFASWRAGFGLVSRSRREWKVLHALRQRGIHCPQPMAVGQKKGRAFLLVKPLTGVLDLAALLQRNHDRSETESRQLACVVAKAVAEFHATGFSHPDLYAKHIFIHVQKKTVHFIDFQRTRYRRRVAWRQRGEDLAALDVSLNDDLVSPRVRRSFLAAYVRASGTKDRCIAWQIMLQAMGRRKERLLRRSKVREMRERSSPQHFMELNATPRVTAKQELAARSA